MRLPGGKPMSNDELLKALGSAARDGEAADTLDENWDRYSAGELTDEELAELVSRGDQPTHAEQAFRPLDEDFRRKLASKAESVLAQQTEQAPSNTVSFPARPRRVLAPLALAASVVLGVALALRMLPGPQVQPLPGYSVTLQGGTQYRSDPSPAETPVFRPSDRLELRLTPETAVEGAVGGIAIAPHPQNLNLFSDVQVEVAPTGAARVVARIGNDPGDYRLLVAIGRADALPDESELAAALAGRDRAAGPGWQAWGYAINVSP